MNILITGYKGFIGQNAVEYFSDHNLSLFEWGEPFPSLEGIDAVMHFGAISSTAELDEAKLKRQNVDFTTKLIDVCAAKNIKVQFSSSASLYGHGYAFKESSPLDPKNPYARSKYEVEKYVEESGYSNVQVFRYFNVYGPHEEHKGKQASPFCQFQQQASELGKIKVFEGSEGFRRDFVHVNEVLRIQEQFLYKNVFGTWNIGSGKTMSFREVAEQFNVPLEEIPMPEIYKNSYQKYTCADLTKLNKTLAL